MLGQTNSIKKLAYYHLQSISRVRHFLDCDTSIKAVLSLHGDVLPGLHQCSAGRTVAGSAACTADGAELCLACHRWAGRTRACDACSQRATPAPCLQSSLRCWVWCTGYWTVARCLPTSGMCSQGMQGAEPCAPAVTSAGWRCPAPTTYGDRIFSVCALALWNTLPCNIRELATYTSFKAALKTHLFCDHLNQTYFGIYLPLLSLYPFASALVYQIHLTIPKTLLVMFGLLFMGVAVKCCEICEIWHLKQSFPFLFTVTVTPPCYVTPSVEQFPIMRLPESGARSHLLV